jgi:hypothetical protein
VVICVCMRAHNVYVHNKFIYIHINLRLYHINNHKLIEQLVIRSSSTRVRNKIKRAKFEQNI